MFGDAVKNSVMVAAIVIAIHLAIKHAGDQHENHENRVLEQGVMLGNEVAQSVDERAGAMPMDGLKEMFEFATNSESWHSCNIPQGDALRKRDVMEKTSCVTAEQGRTSDTVLNTYDGESIANGGQDVVTAFDGWGSGGHSFV